MMMRERVLTKLAAPAAALPFLLLSGGCTSYVNITSEPTGARVWIYGEECGRTPLRAPVFHSAAAETAVMPQVTLEHPDCHRFTTELRRRPYWELAWLYLSGLFLRRPVENQHFVLAPRREEPASSASPEAPGVAIRTPPAPEAPATPPPPPAGAVEPEARPAGPWTVRIYVTSSESDFLVRGYTPGYGSDDWSDTGLEEGMGVRVGYALHRGRTAIHLEVGLESSKREYGGTTPDLSDNPIQSQRLHTHVAVRAAFGIGRGLQAHVFGGHGFFESDPDEYNPSPVRAASASGSGPHLGVGLTYAFSGRADVFFEYRLAAWKGTWEATDGRDYPMEEDVGGLQVGLAVHF